MDKNKIYRLFIESSWLFFEMPSAGKIKVAINQKKSGKATKMFGVSTMLFKLFSDFERPGSKLVYFLSKGKIFLKSFR